MRIIRSNLTDFAVQTIAGIYADLNLGVIASLIIYDATSTIYLHSDSTAPIYSADIKAFRIDISNAPLLLALVR